MYTGLMPCSFAGACHSSLTGGQASETSSSAAESTWQGQVDIHVAQRVSRSRFVEQLEQEPDLDASEASQQEAQAAADALAEAARRADVDVCRTSVQAEMIMYNRPDGERELGSCQHKGTA